jgi:hypothetical protein
MATEAETKVRLILKNYLYKDEVDKVFIELERQGIVLTSLYQTSAH